MTEKETKTSELLAGAREAGGEYITVRRVDLIVSLSPEGTNVSDGNEDASV
jgi:hypothetical protein